MNIRTRSVDRVISELMGSTIHDNLQSQLRRGTAKLAKVKPRRQSFSRVWLSLKDHVLGRECYTFERW